jgi:hypothetical protein
MSAAASRLRRGLGPALALALGACGGGSGDLIALERSGGAQPQPLRIVVTSDGRARCDGGPLRAIGSELLLDARETERELGDLAETNRSFGRRPNRPRYVARTDDGTVRWTEGTPLPPELPRAQLLLLRLRRAVCGER